MDCFDRDILSGVNSGMMTLVKRICLHKVNSGMNRLRIIKKVSMVFVVAFLFCATPGWALPSQGSFSAPAPTSTNANININTKDIRNSKELKASSSSSKQNSSGIKNSKTSKGSFDNPFAKPSKDSPLFSMNIVKPPKITEDLILEVLKLPSLNRTVVFQKWGRKGVSSHLRSIAFNTKHSMPMRWRALTALAMTEDKDSLDDLIEASEQPEWFMRNGALVGLAHIDKKRSVELAVRFLKEDSAMVVRAAAADILKEHGQGHHRDLLWKSLGESKNFHRGQSLWVRQNIAQAFLRVSQKGDEPKMIQLLNDKDQQLQAIGIRGLERLNQGRLGERDDTLEEQKKLWSRWWQRQTKSL